MAGGPDVITLGLVRQACLGDTESFAALYQRYETRVFRTAYLILGDAGRAEEITQDVFVQVYQQLKEYRPDRGAFSTWLQRITVNLCLNSRRRKVLAWFSLDRAHAEQMDLDATAQLPIEQVLRSEEQQRTWQAIQSLSLHLRTVVVLRYHQDLSYEEIAQVLACPIGTVRSRLHTAHARLRLLLEE